MSEPIDLSTARLLAREACDGVVAPGYEDGAVEILQRRRAGRFCVLEMDPTFEPEPLERRDVFGVTIEQPRNALSLAFLPGARRPDRDNAVDGYVRGGLTERERAQWLLFFEREPEGLGSEARADWLSRLTGVALASDGLFPFRDDIDVASTAGVTSIVQPGGSARDEEVIAAFDDYGMSMAMCGVRLFHH
jgi:phosphoribosylaminoimidazolecarboxamide formyltransferase / IMP cyclohydrolase